MNPKKRCTESDDTESDDTGSDKKQKTNDTGNLTKGKDSNNDLANNQLSDNQLSDNQSVNKGLIDKKSVFDKNSDKVKIVIGTNCDIYQEVLRLTGSLYMEQSGTGLKEAELHSLKNREESVVLYDLPLDTEVVIKYTHNNDDGNMVLTENQDKIETETHYVTAYRYKSSSDHGTSYAVMYQYELILWADTIDTLNKFIVDACTEKETLTIYHYNAKHGFWKTYGRVQERDPKTLILDKGIKNMILTDIKEFEEKEDVYKKFGIPYKRNYLFHGKPGTGKTTLTNVIANCTNRSIYILSFDPEMTDNVLKDAVQQIGSDKAILLLEDIDCIFQDRSSATNNSNVSFSGLLNVLDGVAKVKSLITIVTTNYVKKLDSALIRPGRIDMMVEFSVITEVQIDGLLDLYEKKLDKNIIKKLYKICKNDEIVPSALSGFLFNNISKPDIIGDTFIEEFRKYIKNISVNKDMSDVYRNMYT